MSTKDGGTSVAIIKSLGVSKSGKNWKVETDKGVINFAKKEFKDMPAMSIGKQYFIEWYWFDIPDSTNAMRMAEEWRQIGPNDADTDTREQSPHRAESTQKTTHSTQKETHREPVERDTTIPMNGSTIGLIWKNSFEIVGARIKVGVGKADPASIKADVTYFNEWQEGMMKAGKLYEPF